MEYKGLENMSLDFENRFNVEVNDKTDINIKRQIDDSLLYLKEAKIKNKLKKIKEDF